MTKLASSHLDAIPTLGSGMGYRRELREQIFASRDRIDVLEIVTEQFFGGDQELEELVALWPVIPHGVGLSIGTAGALDWEYLHQVRRVSERTGSPYYSEHLAITRAPGIDIGHLAPLWFTEEALRTTIHNVDAVQSFLGKPLVLENISYLLSVPGATMPQDEFFGRMVEATGCGVLLDVANVHINAQNHSFDPVAFLDAMPLHAVVQIHLAGGYWADDVYIDAHSEPVNGPTWELLSELADRVPIRVSILEQDANFPDQITPILADVDRSRSVIAAAARR
ncbi:DUF692 domain-containing protein [Nocardioides aequoreus]|uniref:DUF692 domain-containing protein n=1 Tax=Nocardioides aequoreus TaxID=397278 RepID=UPI0004C430D9|nr:DUF692 domain-containing protein [Nocardioides aequoreus]